jgi:hypothetical protein
MRVRSAFLLSILASSLIGCTTLSEKEVKTIPVAAGQECDLVVTKLDNRVVATLNGEVVGDVTHENNFDPNFPNVVPHIVVDLSPRLKSGSNVLIVELYNTPGPPRDKNPWQIEYHIKVGDEDEQPFAMQSPNGHQPVGLIPSVTRKYMLERP